jgi:hypothetical protein
MTTPNTPYSGAAPNSGAVPNSNDPDEIRREIERTQARLSADVNVLGEKVSPGAIVNRRVDRVRNSAGRLKDKVMGSNPSTSTYSGTHLGGSGGGFRDTAHGAASSVSGAASSAAGTVSDAASSAAGTVSDAASSAASAVQAAPQAVRQQTQGHPLAAGLIAFGVGWLASSLLPASRREQELAEQAKERASDLGQPLAQVANEVKANLAGPAPQAVESVKSTAPDAGQTVAQEGRAAAGHVQGQARDSADTVRQSAQSG